MKHFALPRRALRTGVALAALSVTAPFAIAQEAAESGWSYTVESLATGVNFGYQLAYDPVSRQVYFTDAHWRVENRGPDGAVAVERTASGKVVAFDAASRTVSHIYSYLDLTRNDGSGPDRAPLDWSGVTDPATTSLASNRTSFSPNGIAVDGTTTNANGEADATIITTSARGRDLSLNYGGHVVIFNASQDAPTDADRLWQFEDGSPMFDGIRRIAVNSNTHKAYVTNFAEARADAGERPGFIGVVDLQSRTLDARVRIPEMFGAIGVTVDEENNLVYVGSMTGGKLFVIDASKVDPSDAQNLDLNAGAITELEADIGENARPTYDPVAKRIYVSAYADPEGVITVVDGDPQSADYGKVIDTVQTGPTNFVAVDAERGLLYSANLGAQEVVVYDADTLDELLRLPTSGNALNLAVDPETHEVWVANFRDASFTDVFTLHAPQ